MEIFVDFGEVVDFGVWEGFGFIGQIGQIHYFIIRCCLFESIIMGDFMFVSLVKLVN